MTMPCFAKGEAAIAALEKRINPPGIINDSLLNEHCQNLINESLDNWASKWYDRFQYWAQGIFY
jgi:phosphatidylinositol 4-kinase